MLFNSLSFAVFMTVIFFVYWLLPQKFRWPLLLIASYYFYMSWNPKYVVLILFTTIVSYVSALAIDKVSTARTKKLVLTVAIISCLGVLFFFKYFNFTSEIVTSIANKLAIPLNPITLKVLLPVGISFYTFQTLSYVIDVYRGTVKPERNFGIYATFISFFPQLVAGPIERTNNLLPQIKSNKIFDYNKVSYGLKLMAWGFFKKLAVADYMAIYVDKAYKHIGSLHGIDCAIAILFFTFQIYCDFSGYSDIAIGAAKLLGIDLMTNFKSPYFSKSIKEFWSRWHISLSTWFRDYVYIPLGGNRCSKFRNKINLMITFLASGLWHGAGWNFIVWGGIHGFIQVLEKNFNIKTPKSKKAKLVFSAISTLVVFAICNIAWVFFRADTINDAVYIIKTAFVSLAHPKEYFDIKLGLKLDDAIKIGISLLILTVFDYFSLKTDVIKWVSNQKLLFRWTYYVAIIILIVLCIPITNQTTFIYFQF